MRLMTWRALFVGGYLGPERAGGCRGLQCGGGVRAAWSLRTNTRPISDEPA